MNIVRLKAQPNVLQSSKKISNDQRCDAWILIKNWFGLAQNRFLYLPTPFILDSTRALQKNFEES